MSGVSQEQQVYPENGGHGASSNIICLSESLVDREERIVDMVARGVEHINDMYWPNRLSQTITNEDHHISNYIRLVKAVMPKDEVRTVVSG